jgi:hypothetical protein
MMATEIVPQATTPTQADWPELRSSLLHQIERDETRWQTRLVNATSERAADIAESVLSDVWFVQSTLEEATGPLEAWRRLDQMRAGRQGAPAWIGEVLARLAQAMYGPVGGFSLEEEVARA